MKILQLCKKFPFPLKDGESIAVTYLAKAFQELGSDVTLLAMNTSKHWFDPGLLPPGFDHYQAIHTVDIDNHIRPFAALANLFSDRSYHVERFENPAFAEKLIEILQDDWFDVIQLETLYLAPYIPLIRQHSSALIALRAHNVEHEIWERVAAQSNPLKKWYLNTITPRLKKFETEHLNRYDLLIGITERDVEQFRNLGLTKPAVVIPIGLDCRDYMADDACFRQPLRLGFIGSLDWMPNAEGLAWFLDKVWKPLLAPEFPQLHFHIAGRNTPAWLKRLRLPRVHVHGEVPDAAAFINAHAVMVVPLLSGSGMRAKILEGMALGKAVLSTTIGLEGINARHRRETLIADTPEEFYSAIRWCYSEGPQLVRLGQRAQVFCTENFDNLEVARQLLHTYQSMRPRQPVPA
ncbi:MAG: glycosyltransferase family 4 protein [Saprospirales bacterium]|nr:glycosyltransferase family 4 protein [Saprospirales bacterium]MBK8921308.1 glycosyltransferase family 4 protein [Saprospirales bacterium]